MRLSVTKVASLHVVRVEGDLDAGTADQFHQTLREATGASADGARHVVIDLEDCTYIDSAGLGVLFSLAGWARQAGGWVAAVRPRAEILRILQLVRLTDERGFQVFSDLESARSALQPA